MPPTRMFISKRMAMADLSIILGLLLLIIKSTLCSKYYWSEIQIMRNYLPKSNFTATTTESLLECVIYSQHMDGCLVIAYNTVTNACSPLYDLRQRQYEESTYVWYAYDEDCGSGWVQSEESCYLFADMSKTWQDASAYCAALSSHLAVIETETEDIFIRNLLLEEYGNTIHIYYLLDGTFNHTEGQWKWAASDTPIGYTNWNPAEPSSGLEDCIALTGFMGFLWNDVVCSAPFRFICEREKRTFPVPAL